MAINPIEYEAMRGPGAKESSGEFNRFADAGRAGERSAEGVRRTLDKMSGSLGGVKKLLRDVVGPWAVATAVGWGFRRMLVSVGRDSEVVQRGLERLSKIQLAERQLAPLVGGLAAAKKHVRELDRMTRGSKSPFAFDDAVAGSAKLQVLTNGVYALGPGFKTVGDTAAGTGNSINDTAGAVGELYDRLQRGEPVEDVTAALRGMGIITESAEGQVNSLSGSAGNFAAAWAVVDTQMQRNAGSMAVLGKEVAGLQQRLVSAQDQQAEKLAAPFQAGQKADLEAQINQTEAMTAALEPQARLIGAISSAWSSFKGAIVEALTGSDQAKERIKLVAASMYALIAILAGGFIIEFSKGVIALIGWLQLLGVKLLANAAAAGRASGAFGILTGMAKALGWSFKATAIAGGVLVAMLAVLGGWLIKSWSDTQALREENDGLAQSMQDTAKAMRDQIAAIRTMADWLNTTADAYQNVLTAQEAYRSALQKQSVARNNLNPFDNAEADRQVSLAKEGLSAARAQYSAASAVGVGGLAGDREQVAAAKERLRIERDIREQAGDAVLENLSGQDRVAALKKRQSESEARLATAEGEQSKYNDSTAGSRDAALRMQNARNREAQAVAKANEFNAMNATDFAENAGIFGPSEAQAQNSMARDNNAAALRNAREEIKSIQAELDAKAASSGSRRFSLENEQAALSAMGGRAQDLQAVAGDTGKSEAQREGAKQMIADLRAEAQQRFGQYVDAGGDVFDPKTFQNLQAALEKAKVEIGDINDEVQKLARYKAELQQAELQSLQKKSDQKDALDAARREKFLAVSKLGDDGGREAGVKIGQEALLDAARKITEQSTAVNALSAAAATGDQAGIESAQRRAAEVGALGMNAEDIAIARERLQADAAGFDLSNRAGQLPVSSLRSIGGGGTALGTSDTPTKTLEAVKQILEQAKEIKGKLQGSGPLWDQPPSLGGSDRML